MKQCMTSMYQRYLLPREIEAQAIKRHQFLKNRHSCFFPVKPHILLTKYERWEKMAKLMGLSRKACMRLEWIIYHHTKAGNNTCLTCRHFNVSRRIFYYWFNRFQEDNLRTLEDQDRAPKQVRQREITSSQEQRIIFLRKTHIHWGKEKLAIIYLKTYQEKISCWKIQKTIEKYRLYPNPRRNQRIQSKRLRARRKKRITEFRKKPVLGYLVHFDTIVIYWNGLKRYIFTAIDEFTKIAFARMYTSKSSSNARDFFYRVNYLLDNRILNSHQDNGSEFQKHFEQACQKENVEQYYNRPRTPKDNPSLERFNQTLEREWLNDGHFTPDIQKFNRELSSFLVEYAFVRPHNTLGNLTPIEWAIKYRQLSQMYPSSTFV